MSSIYIDRSLCLCLFSSMWLYIGQSLASVPTWDPAQSVTDPGWHWSDAQQLELPGAYLQMWRFRTAVSPVRAAQQLSEAAGQHLALMQFSGSVLLLSGWQAGQHWLVQLQPLAQGAQGLISSLSAKKQNLNGFDPASYLPAGARRVLQIKTHIPQAPGFLASYDCPGQLNSVIDSVHQALTAARWRRQTSVSPAVTLLQDSQQHQQSEFPALFNQNSSTWLGPGEAELTVHLFRRTHSVVVTFWYQSKGSS